VQNGSALARESEDVRRLLHRHTGRKEISDERESTCRVVQAGVEQRCTGIGLKVEEMKSEASSAGLIALLNHEGCIT
jgi:hypothetical protein